MDLKIIIIIGVILTILSIGVNVFAYFLEKKYKNDVLKDSKK